jgi:CAAX prenyl protease-like protein
VTIRSNAIARVAPFALFISFLALDGRFGSVLMQVGLEARWSYVFRAGAAGITLILLWNRYDELRHVATSPVLSWFVAFVCGLVVFALWILPYPGWATQDGNIEGVIPVNTQGMIDWGWVLVRTIGASLLVPVMEELFWRSFLMRWLAGPAFTRIQPSSIRLHSVLVASALFAAVHELWVAGFLAGIVYGLLYRKYGNLWLPIFAHAMTNTMLAAWVVWTAQWQYW